MPEKVSALLLDFLLSPLVRLLGKARIPTVAGATIVVLALVGAFALGVYQLGGTAQRFLDDAPQSISRAQAQIGKIVDIQLQRMQKYFEARRMTLDLTDKARALLASEGYDPVFGARPLKRVMQRKILDALATEILKGGVKDGDHITGDVAGKDSDELTFKVKQKKG